MLALFWHFFCYTWVFMGIYDYQHYNYAILLENDISDVTALKREYGGKVSISDSAISIIDSNNKTNSLAVNSAGDIGLANGSVFIDKSTNRMGIGTAVPVADLHIGSSAATIALGTGASGWHMKRFGSAFAIGQSTSAYPNPFIIYNNATQNNLVLNNGGVGIGKSNPTEKLDIFAEEDGARLVLSTAGDGTYDAPQFTSRRAGSDGSGNPSATQSTDVMGSFAWRGHDGTDWTGAKAYMMIRSVGNWSGANTGTSIQIAHTPYNSTVAKVAMEIKGDADVYIPNGDLYVSGHKMNVPDYVFKDGYKLMPLAELKTYIQKNYHLPGVASADEVGKAGVVNLSGMQMTLLEKVEELTLYTLQQEEKLKKAQEKIAKLETMQKRLVKVESLLTNLALETSNNKIERVSLNHK